MEKKKVLLCGAAMSGNMGAQALYLSVLKLLGNEEWKFTVLSKYPVDDAASCKEHGFEMASYRTGKQIVAGLLFFIFGGLFKKLHLPWKWMAKGTLKTYLENDVLVDCSGISFSDHRGFSSLVINCLWLLPAIVTGIPIIKISQAMGPFRKRTVKMAAKYILPKVKTLVARGETSAEYVRELLPEQEVMQLPDIAFALSPKSVDDIFQEAGIEEGRRFCLVGPSSVLAEQTKVKGISYVETMADFVGILYDELGLPVVLLPHERAHTQGSHFDDLNACRAVEQIGRQQNIDVRVVAGNYDADVLKGFISRAEIAVASRFHLLVACMSTGVPSMGLTWSHKYYEMMKPFGQEDFAVDFRSIDVPEAAERLLNLIENKQAIREEIIEKGNQVLRRAERHGELIQEIVSRQS